jgi:hypothetical protein
MFLLEFFLFLNVLSISVYAINEDINCTVRLEGTIQILKIIPTKIRLNSYDYEEIIRLDPENSMSIHLSSNSINFIKMINSTHMRVSFEYSGLNRSITLVDYSIADNLKRLNLINNNLSKISERNFYGRVI